MRLLSLGLILVSTLAFGSEGHGSQTDIIERTLNFVLFVALLWYLLAERVKNYFAARTAAISGSFEKIQEKLKDAKAKREAAAAKLSEAKAIAEDLVKNARKEGEIFVHKIEESAAEEVRLMEKHFDEMVASQTKIKTRQVVAEVIDELFATQTISMSGEQFAAKLNSKAA